MAALAEKIFGDLEKQRVFLVPFISLSEEGMMVKCLVIYFPSKKTEIPEKKSRRWPKNGEILKVLDLDYWKGSQQLINLTRQDAINLGRPSFDILVRRRGISPKSRGYVLLSEIIICSGTSLINWSSPHGGSIVSYRIAFALPLSLEQIPLKNDLKGGKVAERSWEIKSRSRLENIYRAKIRKKPQDIGEQNNECLDPDPFAPIPEPGNDLQTFQALCIGSKAIALF